MASGFINAIAGGGGLIVLPVMLWLGIPPINALATGKFQALFGSLASAINYFHKGFINPKPLLPVIFFCMLTSVLGTYSVLQIPIDLLQQLLPYFLIGIAIYIGLSPRLSDQDHKPLMPYRHFKWVAGGAIGFYCGFFGPGVGTIAALIFSGVAGYNLRKATASAKPVVVAANAVSVLMFLWAGHVFIVLGLCMAVAQILGGYMGSNLVIRHGSSLIKPMLMLVTIAIAVKLILQL